MAHDKVYGVCENKCFVGVEPLMAKVPPLIPTPIKIMTLGEYEELTSGAPDADKVKRQIKSFWEKTSIDHAYSYSDGIYTFDFPNVSFGDVHEILNSKVIVKHKSTSASGHSQFIDVEVLPLKIHLVKGTLDTSYTITTASFAHDELDSSDDVYIQFDYVVNVTE